MCVRNRFRARRGNIRRVRQLVGVVYIYEWVLLWYCCDECGRWFNEGYFPLSNLYESLIFLSWGISITHLFIEWKTQSRLIGAIAATEAQGLEGDIKIFGWDLTSHSINGIDKGYVISVVQQSPYGMGQYAVGALNDNFNGKMSPRVVDVPITLVDKSNVSKFK